MEPRLFSHAELQGTCYAEFSPGAEGYACFWSKDSVYLEMEAFEATDRLVGHFNLFGPVTLSGSRLQKCIDDLLAAAKRVSQAESPEDVWDPAYCPFLEIEDWQQERRQFSIMLRDLAKWMRHVQARKQPVTCNGL